MKNNNKKKNKQLGGWSDEPYVWGQGDRIRLLPVSYRCPKISRVRRSDELKCRCAVRLMSQCCRAVLKLLAPQRQHHCLQAQEPLFIFYFGVHPSCCFLLAGLRLVPEILVAAENKSNVPEFRLEITAIHCICWDCNCWNQANWWHDKTMKATDGFIYLFFKYHLECFSSFCQKRKVSPRSSDQLFSYFWQMASSHF